MNFDAKYYLAQYPDVSLSGMTPLEHYLWIGQRLGRSGARSLSAEKIHVAEENLLDALFIDGTNGSPSTPYRVHRIADGLSNEGWKVRCARGDEVESLLNQDISVRFVIVFRAPFWSPFREFVGQMREKRSTIIYDVDDYVFDEDVIPYVDGYRHLSGEDKVGYRKGVRAYRDFILNADFCTATTNFLVERIRQMGKPAYRVPNAISEENRSFFKQAPYQRRLRPDLFTIGYYSGTRTHQADFRTAAEALVRFMQEYPNVMFRLVGELDLTEFPELDAWQSAAGPNQPPRVTRVGLMPHDLMIRDQFNCDLIIAPLEVGNPFCEAKSELKFFEASLAGCPVIASATQTFAEATANGTFAELALTTEDWLRAFRKIYLNYPQALERAHQASQAVADSYSQTFAAHEAISAYERFGNPDYNVNQTSRSAKRPVATIGVIIPDFSGPSGGHRKIFTVCDELERLGYTLKFYVNSTRSPLKIKQDISRLFFELDGEVCLNNGIFDDHEVVLCTHWLTAYEFRTVKHSGRVIYFVQDYEPMFSAVGSDYIRAMASYQLGFEIICYGRWVNAKLQDEVGVASQLIPFTLAHETYYRPPIEKKRDIDVLVYARPSQDRRCFSLTCEALAQLKQRRPDTRIVLFGEEQYPELGFAVENEGSITDLRSLAKLYHRAKIGICLSPTNPSQLGYEMVACGANLIDVRIKFSELNFDGDDFVTYVDGTPESLAKACAQLLGNPEELKRRRKRGYAFAEAMADDCRLGGLFAEAAGLSGELQSDPARHRVSA